MSLPTAPKDISNNPKSGSVVDPVVKADKDADVERKLHFYGVIEAFRQGRMPDNNQIDSTLRYICDTSPIDIDKLSNDGRKLIQDARDIIETARLMVKEKNADELFQNFVWHTRDVGVNLDLGEAKKEAVEALGVDKAKAKDDGQAGMSLLLDPSTHHIDSAVKLFR